VFTSAGPIYLGLDLSTQSLTAVGVIVGESGPTLVVRESVRFDTALPQYGTVGGVHVKDGGTVVSPAAMWVGALDRVLIALRKRDFPFSRVAAVSVSGQQHGSVYWRVGAAAKLAALCTGSLPPQPHTGLCLESELCDMFSVSESPVWMDSSTTAQCERLEQAVGGPKQLAELTGPTYSFIFITVSKISDGGRRRGGVSMCEKGCVDSWWDMCSGCMAERFDLLADEHL
jgi:xylulokinase